MNSNGVVVKSIPKKLTAGAVKTSLDLSTVEKGNYILVLTTGSAQALTKLIKK